MLKNIILANAANATFNKKWAKDNGITMPKGFNWTHLERIKKKMRATVAVASDRRFVNELDKNAKDAFILDVVAPLVSSYVRYLTADPSFTCGWGLANSIVEHYEKATRAGADPKAAPGFEKMVQGYVIEYSRRYIALSEVNDAALAASTMSTEAPAKKGKGKSRSKSFKVPPALLEKYDTDPEIKAKIDALSAAMDALQALAAD